jgi:hypothetical protein
MKNIAIVVAILSGFIMGPVAAAGADQDAQIARILRALDFGEDAKLLFSKRIARGDLDAETTRLLGSITEEQFVEIAAPLFSSVISAEEAKELAAFYESDAMQAMLAEQKRTGSSAPVATTREQAAAVREFYGSRAAQSLTRVQESLRNPDLLSAFVTAVEKHLSNVQ